MRTALLVSLLVTGGVAALAPDSRGLTAPAQLTGSVPLDQCFIQEGADPPRYVLLGTGIALSVETGGLRWRVTEAGASGARLQCVVEVEPVGTDLTPTGAARLPGVVSRFHGAPEDWRRAEPTFRSVRCDQVWDGIDLRLDAVGRTLKATWSLAAGVDPAQLRLRHRGAEAIRIDADGRLVIETGAGVVLDEAPCAWQLKGQARVDVHVAYRLERLDDGAVDVGFEVGEHDRSLPLLIDPAVLVQAGFLGGIAADKAEDAAVDAAGNVYLCGTTLSTETSFPVVNGPGLINHLGAWGDAFVAKLDPTGTTLLYCGFIGGTDNDYANAVAADASGRAYLTGTTNSSPAELFPVIGGPDLSFGLGQDGWVARVAADGSALEYCGYIGASQNEDRGLGIDVDANNRAYVVGHVDGLGTGFPLVAGPSFVPRGGIEAWVARLAPDGLSFEFCGYVGGNGYDEALDVKADGAGGAWICGLTDSDQNFPVAGGPRLTYGGWGDGFVAHVAADGSHLLWCGYIGGDQIDAAHGVSADAAGAVYVVGRTISSQASFAPVVGPDLTVNGGHDAFVTKISPNGLTLVYSGYIGGNSHDYAYGVDVDSAGGAWVVGKTESSQTSFPAAGGPDSTFNGSSDGFMARVLPDGTGLEFAGYVGGSGFDQLNGIELVPAGLLPATVTRAWAAGTSTSTESSFPVISGPDLTANGQEDAILVAVQAGPDPWVNLGQALAGVNGNPLLVGSGTLVAQTPVAVSLTNARANAPAYLVMGVAAINLPFRGGTLVPAFQAPSGLFVALATDGAGRFEFNSLWPPGIPSDVTLYVQYWIEDPAGPFGFAASNAVAGTAP